MYEHYKILADGWFIGYLGIKGKCNSEGEPFLYKNFLQDDIGFNSNLSYLLSNLWYKAHMENMTTKQLQFNLDKLFRWHNVANKFEPSFNLRKATISKIKKLQK